MDERGRAIGKTIRAKSKLKWRRYGRKIKRRQGYVILKGSACNSRAGKGLCA